VVNVVLEHKDGGFGLTLPAYVVLALTARDDVERFPAPLVCANDDIDQFMVSDVPSCGCAAIVSVMAVAWCVPLSGCYGQGKDHPDRG
jgi:hypothetical protein